MFVKNAIGVDISSYDVVYGVKWNIAISRGISWATIRATRGLLTDFDFQMNWRDAGLAGIRRMPYHWYVPRTSWQQQADFFVKNSYIGELPHMIDLEDTYYVKAYKGIFAAEIIPFLQSVEKATGKTPTIYTSPSYMVNYWNNEIDVSRFPLIIANWKVTAPKIPFPWLPTNYLAWQTDVYVFGNEYGLESKEIALYVWNGEEAKV